VGTKKAVNIFEARMGRAITRRKAPFLIGSESFPLLIFFPLLSRFSLLYLILSVYHFVFCTMKDKKFMIVIAPLNISVKL
jgi:hypothetical protein